MMSFGASVRAKRVSEGIGLIEFAKRLGLSPAYWSRVELEREHPPRDIHVEKTAAILGIRLDDLYVEAGRLPPDMRENLREVVRIYRANRQEWMTRMNAAGLLNARPKRNWHEEIITPSS
jgi:HTH-type transcriptional regulator, competence development regulator